VSDHAQLPPELQRELIAVVQQTQQRSGWPVRRSLRVLEIPPGSFYRWRRKAGGAAAVEPRSAPGSLYALLESERRAIVQYALAHPELRHRELAWKMLDENVVGVSSSSVYRVLREAQLVCPWKPQRKAKGSGAAPAPTRPDQLWQTDIRYVKLDRRNYYLLSFLDVYSRYVVYHELLARMDGLSVSIAAAAALATLPADVRPTIQSDHGSGFVAREFAGTLAESGVGHTLIRPHTPTDNAHIERYQRTVGEQIDERLEASEDLDVTAAEAVIEQVIDHYNHQRLHSALNFLRPVDYYRGNPAALLAKRRRKLVTARELRKQENLQLRQRRLPWTEARNVSYPPRASVSL
jgi:putative transposase